MSKVIEALMGDSDHFLVIANLSLKLSTIWKKKRQFNTMHKLNRCKLRDQKAIIEYQKRIKEGLNCCTLVQNEINNVINLTQIKESINKVAVTLRDTKRKSKNHWFNDECQEAIMKRKRQE
jgi:hypothetical protein